MSRHSVSRSTLLRLVAVTFTLAAPWLAPPVIAQETTMPAKPAEHYVPADKGFSKEQIAALYQRGTQRVYTADARTTIGMPCGGLCAGQLYVLGDGTLGCWQIDGQMYFSTTGDNNYRTYRPPQPIAQGFALAVAGPDGHFVRATLDDAGYNAIEFIGEYPRAIIHYRAKGKPVPPVQVDLEVFSPFIPLNAQESAYPATVLRFTITNPTDQKLNVALGGWLENMVFSGLSKPVTVLRRNRTASRDSLATVLLDAIEQRPAAPAGPPVSRVIADFESGTYQGWTVTGEAFGKAPAAGTLPNQNPVTGFGGKYLVNSFNGDDKSTGKMVSDPFKIDLPYLTFRIGGGAHEGKTCMNLVVDGKVVRTATGRESEKLDPRVWDVKEFTGREANLEIIDDESGPWGHINVDDIALTNTLSADFKEYNEAALSFGNMALSLVGPGIASPQWPGEEGFIRTMTSDTVVLAEKEETTSGFDQPLVGTVTAGLSLAPKELRTVTFIVSWYFPNLHTGHGRMYANWFKDARDVAHKLAANLDRLHAETVRFCDTYYRDTTLPWWLASRLLMPASTLATGTAQWWLNDRFWAWEGVCCCEGTCTHVWNYAQAQAWLFPELARSARTMQDLDAALDAPTGLVGFRGNRNFAADGQAGTILKCYREHLTSPDMTFLRKYWRRIALALEYLIREDGNADGIIENDRQHNTYDINFVGPNTFVGSLYLAALRAGEEMANLMGETEDAQRYHEIFARGSQWTVENLFNGEYFEQRVPPRAADRYQYGRGCLADQLFGQTWAHVLDLGYIYPRDKVRGGLAAVFKYDWAPDVAPQNAKFPPQRPFARPGEPGLFTCTWPRGGRPAEPVLYRDEIWTGIEYQVAAGLAWEGFADEALLIVDGVERRYDGKKHNPWNEIECGDHYARALASWGVLHALAGYTWDGPAGKLGLAPRMQQDDFACFFSTGTGWGLLGQQRKDGVQTNRVDVRAGTVRLTQLTLAPLGAVKSAEVTILGASGAGGTAPAEQKIAVQVTPGDGRCELKFDQPLALNAGQQLLVVLR